MATLKFEVKLSNIKEVQEIVEKMKKIRSYCDSNSEGNFQPYWVRGIMKIILGDENV